MTSRKGKTHSSELLKIEANRLEMPACFHLNNNNPTKKLSTYRPPPSSVLNRARSFLPQLAMANKELENKMAILPASKFDIENLDDCPGSHIEMDIAIVARDSNSSESSDEDNSAQNDDDDENSDGDGDSVLCSSALSKAEPALFNTLDVESLKLPRARPVLKKKSIQVLDDISTENENKDRSRVTCHSESTR